MISKFREKDRAVAFLWRGLREHGEEVHVEIASFPAHQSTPRRTTITSVARLGPLLEHLSRRFSGGTVLLEADYSGRPVAMLQCRCEHIVRDACAHRCQHHQQRPTICLMVCSPEQRPAAEQLRALYDWFQEQMHQYQVAYRKGHPTEYRRRHNHHHRAQT